MKNRILIITPNSLGHHFWSRNLNDSKVIVVRSERSGKRIAEQWKPDLIVVDACFRQEIAERWILKSLKLLLEDSETSHICCVSRIFQRPQLETLFPQNVTYFAKHDELFSSFNHDEIANVESA